VRKATKLLIGAILCLVGLGVIALWFGDVLTLVRGGIGFGLIILGFLFFAVASD